MLDKFNAVNETDDENPAGGYVYGTGLDIEWQNGPLGRPNGAFVETVIAAAKQRIEYYQQASGGKFACEANAFAIEHLDAALNVLHERLSMPALTFPIGETILSGTIHVDAGIVIGAAFPALENKVIRKANPGSVEREARQVEGTHEA